MNKESTLSQLFLQKTQKSLNRKAIGWIEGQELKFYTNEYYQKNVSTLFYGLIALGVKDQDKVAILSQTSKEWHFMDLAILCAKAVVIPIYPTYLAEEVEYILNHSETKVLVLENESQLHKIIEVQDQLKQLEIIVSFKDISEELKAKLKKEIIFYSYSQLLDKANELHQQDPALFEQKIAAGKKDDLASIIYTSGTTGNPKGAVITHEAFVVMLSNVHTSLKSNITPADRTLTFLPLSHVLGRCDSFLNIIFDFECVYAESLDKVVENLAIAKPTVLVAVPRIFEKVYSKVLENIQHESNLKQKVFSWALDASSAYYEKINQDKSPSTFEIIQKNLAYKLVFEKIYNKFGGKIRFLVSGGAPLSPDIMKFLQNANLTILEGYGLTETVAPCILNPPFRQIPGAIGLPLGDVQVKFNDDGEIMLKTKALFKYYLKNEEATKEAFKDGWFLTGDIGELTPEGYVKITDRKKDIIITSAGKNVAPQKIENLLKLEKHISNAMVIGDKRKFLVAIISIDHEAFKDELQDLGLSSVASYEDVASNHKTYPIIDKEVQNVNAHLASFESIKGFIIAPSDFNIENGQLTPSLKLKKKVIGKTYEKEIDTLYKKLES